MSRPTKEDVDKALAGVAAYAADGDASHNESVLAAEIVALREELAESQATARQWQSVAEIAIDTAQRSTRLHEIDAREPGYSTEAVDAALEAWDDWDGDADLVHVINRMNAVRASREPPL